MKTYSFPLNSRRFNTSLALGLLAITPTFSARVSSAAPKSASAPLAFVGEAQDGYVKEVPGVNGKLGTAQTAIRRFAPIRGNGPAVYLVAAIHIGEKSYYKQIQQFLDKQSVVLYEGVRPSRSAIKMRALRAAGMPVGKSPVAPPVGIQQKLSDALNLQFQRDGIQYNRRQFRNSDLDWDTMNALAAKAGPDTQKLLDKLGNSISGGPNVSATEQILDKVLTFSASTPLLAALLRRTLITVLCNSDKIQEMTGQNQDPNGPLASAKKLDSILVNERNKTVLADLKALLKTPQRNAKQMPRPIQSIAIFYGAAHMQDIEQHLISDLGYRSAGGRWITAIQAAH